MLKLNKHIWTALTGTHIFILIKTNNIKIFFLFRKAIITDYLGWPNGLAIDRPAGRLYWNDGQLHVIESSDLTGNLRRTIVSDVPHPYGLVVVGNHMYWTDWQTQALHRADKVNGTDRTVIRDKLEGLMDIRSVQVSIHFFKL